MRNCQQQITAARATGAPRREAASFNHAMNLTRRYRKHPNGNMATEPRRAGYDIDVRHKYKLDEYDGGVIHTIWPIKDARSKI